MARKKGEGHFRKQGDYHLWVLALGNDPVTGKPKRKVIKRKDLKEVKRLVRAYLRDAEDGVPSTQGNAITGQQWADQWLANVRLTRERRTHKGYDDIWRLWLSKHLGKHLLEKIETRHIQAAVNDAIAAGYNTTGRNVLVAAKAMLNAARKQSPPLIKHDPCEGVVVPAAAPERKRILSHDEVGEVLVELYRFTPHKTRPGGHHAYAYRHLIRFMLETGLRESEALGLQEFQVDLKSDPPRVHVVGQLDLDEDRRPYIKAYTKGKDDRTVFLSPAAVESVLAQRKLNAAYRQKAAEAYDEWVLTFPSEAGTPIGVRNFIRQIEELRTALNNTRIAKGEDPMPHWTPHDLRRTFGTRIAQTPGSTLKTTQELLGHKDPKTTAKIYVVSDDEQKIAAIAAMKNRREA